MKPAAKLDKAASLAPSSGAPSPFGRKLRGPKKEPIPDGRALREATRQLAEDRQQAGFNKLFAHCPPNLEQLVEHLRKDHDPKDVITVVVSLRCLLQQIRKSPKYCLHRFHRLLAAVHTIRKAYFSSRFRFVIRMVTLCDRWAALEKSAPRRQGPLSRAAIAAALDEKWDLNFAGDVGSVLQTDIAAHKQKWEPHMAPLMIKRAVLLSQYRRMKEVFLRRWNEWLEKRLAALAAAQRASRTAALKKGGTSAFQSTADTSGESPFTPARLGSAGASKQGGGGGGRSGGEGGGPRRTGSANSRDGPSNPSQQQQQQQQNQRPKTRAELMREKDPTEPRFPWYAILHSLNLQQLIDLTLRTHKHEERLARLATAEAEMCALTGVSSMSAISGGGGGLEQSASGSFLSSPQGSVSNLTKDPSTSLLSAAHTRHNTSTSRTFDPRRMSTVSAAPKTEAESFDQDIIMNAVDEYCSGIERDWVSQSFENEARMSKSPSQSRARSRSPVAGGGGGGANHHHNNTSAASTTVSPPSSAAARHRAATPSSSSLSRQHHRGHDDNDSDSSDSDDSDDNGEVDHLGRTKQQRRQQQRSGGIKRHHHEEPTAQQRLDNMKAMPTLSHFRNWGARPTPSRDVRLQVSSKYHEKLLETRRSEIAKGKSCGQNVVTEHLCLHQLEPFRDMDHFTRSMFMRGVRRPVESSVSTETTETRCAVMQKASKELASAKGLEQIIAVVEPPPMRFAKG